MNIDDYCFSFITEQGGGGWRGTMGEQWLLKQFSLNHPVEHIQKPKLPKLGGGAQWAKITHFGSSRDS